jgi:ribonucleoside-diphosphate reductase alpha chain
MVTDPTTIGAPPAPPVAVSGTTYAILSPHGPVHITINSDEDGPLEVFINAGRAGSDLAALADALARLISLQLRLPSTMSQQERLRQVSYQLRGIGGSRAIGSGKDCVRSLPDAIAQAIFCHLGESVNDDALAMVTVEPPGYGGA